MLHLGADTEPHPGVEVCVTTPGFCHTAFSFNSLTVWMDKEGLLYFLKKNLSKSSRKWKMSAYTNSAPLSYFLWEVQSLSVKTTPTASPLALRSRLVQALIGLSDPLAVHAMVVMQHEGQEVAFLPTDSDDYLNYSCLNYRLPLWNSRSHLKSLFTHSFLPFFLSLYILYMLLYKHSQSYRIFSVAGWSMSDRKYNKSNTFYIAQELLIPLDEQL